MIIVINTALVPVVVLIEYSHVLLLNNVLINASIVNLYVKAPNIFLMTINDSFIDLLLRQIMKNPQKDRYLASAPIYLKCHPQSARSL